VRFLALIHFCSSWSALFTVNCTCTSDDDEFGITIYITFSITLRFPWLYRHPEVVAS